MSGRQRCNKKPSVFSKIITTKKQSQYCSTSLHFWGITVDKYLIKFKQKSIHLNAFRYDGGHYSAFI